MRRSAAAAAVALAAATSLPAFGAQVFEQFNTDPSSRGWAGVQNRHSDGSIQQNYGWSGDPASLTPPAGMEFSLGGRLQRENHSFELVGTPGHDNYYGVPIGTPIDLSTDSFTVSGVIHLQERHGGSGWSIGYGLGEISYLDPFGETGDHNNFIGLNFDDGNNGGAILWSSGGGRGHNGWVDGDLVVGETVSFSMTYDATTQTMTTNVNGTPAQRVWGSDVNDLEPLTHFQIMPVSADGDFNIVWIDDLSFTAEPTVLPPGWNTNIHPVGDWHVGANWIGGIPDTNTETANFGAIAEDTLIYANTDTTVAGLSFTSPETYLLAGLGTLTLDNAAGSALVDVQFGSHKINLPVVIADDTTVNAEAGTTLRISDPVTVNAGVNVIQTGGGTVLYESTVSVLGGGSIQFANNSHMASLTLAAAATATINANGGNTALKVDAINVADGKLDLKDNKLITSQGVGSESGGDYDGVQGLVQAAHNGGAWNGNGITTSMPDAASGLTSIGVANAGQLLGLTAGQTDTFGGQVVTADSTIVMYTYRGDANLDGFISGDDYSAIDFASGTPGADGWVNGDFNWDGIISGDDYSAIDFNIVAQGAPFPTSGGSAGLTAVPEPAAFATLALAAVAASGVRRRRATR